MNYQAVLFPRAQEMILTPTPKLPCRLWGAPQPLLSACMPELAASEPSPTGSKGTFELSPLFQESRGPKGSLLGLQSLGTCYLGQQAKGNCVTSMDKATTRRAGCTKGITRSQIIAGLAAHPPKAPKPQSPVPPHPPTLDIPLLLDHWQLWPDPCLAPGSTKPALTIVEDLVPPGSFWCKQPVSHWDQIPGLFVLRHLRDISDLCAAPETAMYV